MNGPRPTTTKAFKATRVPSQGARGINAASSDLAIARIAFAAADLAPDPGNLNDNLLKTGTEGQDLTVTVADTVDFAPTDGSDSIVLMLDGAILEPTRHIIVNQTAPETFTITAAQHAASRTYAINYRIDYLQGNNFDVGPQDQSFTSDYVAPGFPDLGPPAFEFDTRDGLTPDRLNADGDLEAHVFGYDGVAVYDTLVPLIDGTAGTGTQLDHQPIPGETIVVKYLAASLTGLDGTAHEFGYRVVDRAGNVSPDSAVVTMSTLLDGFINPLAPPDIPEGADGLIDDADARADGNVGVVIPANAALDQNYTIYLKWNEYESTGTPGPTGGNTALTIGVPYGSVYDSWFAVTGDADQEAPAVVSYRIERNGIHAGTSGTTTVQVNLHVAGGQDPDPTTPVHGNLAPPSLKSASGLDNLIPVADTTSPATVFIPFQTNTTPPADSFLANDVITVKYGTTADLTHTVVPGELGADIPITLPAANIGNGGTGTVPLEYTISRPLANGGSNSALSPKRDIVVESATDLPGGGAPLPLAFWPQSEWSTTPGRENSIGPGEAIKGVTIEIPYYDNKYRGDRITVILEMYPTFGHTANEQPIPNRAPSKVINVGELDETGSSFVIFNYRELMYFGVPPLTMHAHIKHTAVAEGSTVVVGSDEGFVIIDSRGQDPYKP